MVKVNLARQKKTEMPPVRRFPKELSVGDLKRSAEVGFPVVMVAPRQVVENPFDEEAVLISVPDLEQFKRGIPVARPDPNPMEPPALPEQEIVRHRKYKKRYAPVLAPGGRRICGTCGKDRSLSCFKEGSDECGFCVRSRNPAYISSRSKRGGTRHSRSHSGGMVIPSTGPQGVRLSFKCDECGNVHDESEKMEFEDEDGKIRNLCSKCYGRVMEEKEDIVEAEEEAGKGKE